jgi:hypothetical protein
MSKLESRAKMGSPAHSLVKTLHMRAASCRGQGHG